MEGSDGGKMVHVGNLILERTGSVSFLGVTITQTDAERNHHQNHNHLAIIKSFRTKFHSLANVYSRRSFY